MRSDEREEFAANIGWATFWFTSTVVAVLLGFYITIPLNVGFAVYYGAKAWSRL